MMQRRAPRPTRGGRTTGTPRARARKPRISGRDRTMGPRPVRGPRPDVRPTKLGGTSASTAASSGAGSAAKAAEEAKLKKLLQERYKKQQKEIAASKARSTGTPRMTKKPATTGRMTRKPTAVGRPRGRR